MKTRTAQTMEKKFKMVNPNEAALLKEFWFYVKDFVLGFLGGVFSHLVPYYKDYHHGKVFLVGMMLTKALLGAFAGWLVGGGIVDDMPFRDAIVALSGLSAFVVVTALDKDFLREILRIWLGRLDKK